MGGYSGIGPVSQLHKISLVQTAGGEAEPANLPSSVVLSSACTNWRHLVVEEHHFPSPYDLDGLMYLQHVIAINIGPPITCEFKKSGRLQRMCKSKGTICLSPSHETLFRRCRTPEENGFADVLCVALDPLFVSQTAEALEIYPDRIELVEQQRPADPAIWNIALALRAGLQALPTSDAIYGESLATALAVHVLREYGRVGVAVQPAHSGLSREKLMIATSYIHDHLNMDLTVAGIARAVHMSPHHFMLLFKQSTGQSPYRYVIEARVRKARDLLNSGKFSISEVTYQAGFADQSHLTRHIKHVYGVTPGMLLERRDLGAYGQH
jgi:AraC family transcriptional regulator